MGLFHSALNSLQVTTDDVRTATPCVVGVLQSRWWRGQILKAPGVSRRLAWPSSLTYAAPQRGRRAPPGAWLREGRSGEQ
jgi:hypothetical protein